MAHITGFRGCIPEVTKESCFALHGGTAINLFVRDLPRLSIDLTYLPIEDRLTTLNNIRSALDRIKNRIEEILADVRIQHKKDIGKLVASLHRTFTIIIKFWKTNLQA